MRSVGIKRISDTALRRVPLVPTPRICPNAFDADSQGVRRTATSSSFGIYSFANVVTGSAYVVGVSTKRYRFSARNLTVNGNMTGVDFVGLE